MSHKGLPESGAVGWIDLAAPGAGDTKDFCAAVVGWQAVPHNTGTQMFCVILDPAGAIAGLIEA